MCVIYACGSKLPSEAELQRGYETNTDGAGIAWIGETKTTKGEKARTVFFKKGMKDDKEVLDFIHKKKIPLPLAIHFRTASVGGAKPSLTHPFPIWKGAPTWLEGSSPEVFFHNGHFSNWEETLMKVGIPAQEKFPEGAWSDSRAMSWVTWLKGEGILQFLVGSSNRILIMSGAPYDSQEYDPASDHFSFWGQGWIHKEGYSQSIDTELRAFTRAQRSAYSVYSPMARNLDADEIEDLTGVGPTLDTHLNVWTMEELTRILSELEAQQRDAKLAAGL